MTGCEYADVTYELDYAPLDGDDPTSLAALLALSSKGSRLPLVGSASLCAISAYNHHLFFRSDCKEKVHPLESEESTPTSVSPPRPCVCSTSTMSF